MVAAVPSRGSNEAIIANDGAAALLPSHLFLAHFRRWQEASLLLVRLLRHRGAPRPPHTIASLAPPPVLPLDWKLEAQSNVNNFLLAPKS